MLPRSRRSTPETLTQAHEADREQPWKAASRHPAEEHDGQAVHPRLDHQSLGLTGPELVIGRRLDNTPSFRAPSRRSCRFVNVEEVDRG